MIFQGLSARQFHSLYKRSFPNALSPARLAASVFRLCDANCDGVVDFEEFLTSVCVPPSRSVGKPNCARSSERAKYILMCKICALCKLLVKLQNTSQSTLEYGHATQPRIRTIVNERET